jgi:hypothetical protein
MARTNTCRSLLRSIQSHLARQRSVTELGEPYLVEGGPLQLGGGEGFMLHGANGEILRVEVTIYKHGI